VHIKLIRKLGLFMVKWWKCLIFSSVITDRNIFFPFIIIMLHYIFAPSHTRNEKNLSTSILYLHVHSLLRNILLSVIIKA